MSLQAKEPKTRRNRTPIGCLTFSQVFAGHESKVSCVMFTTSGKAVISGSDDATVRVWAPRTGECRHTFSGHGFHVGAVTCLARWA